MEYSRSVGDAYETFEGTPQEIVLLINLIDKKAMKSPSSAPSAISTGILPLGGAGSLIPKMNLSSCLGRGRY